MKNIYRTLLFTLILSLITISVTLYIQTNGQKNVGGVCSYIDPITIDVLAFLVAFFLIIEGTARILEHPNASLKRQLTRPIRIAIGCAIITIHILQFIHK